MAEPKEIGDFFAKKTKKKVKGVNLNRSTATANDSAGPAKQVKKDQNEEGWEEQEVEAAVMKVEAAGKLQREDEKKEEEDTNTCRWGNIKNKGDHSLNEKKFPTLNSSIRGRAAVVDDSIEAKMGIKVSRNAFEALEEKEEEEEKKKVVKPALGMAAIKEPAAKSATKAPKKKKPANVEEDNDEEKSEEDEAEEKKVVTKKKPKEQKKEPEAVAETVDDQAEDLKIVADSAASKAKYEGRKRLPPTELRRSELQEEKKQVPASAPSGGKKKKGGFVEEETKKKHLQYLPEDED